MKLKGVWHKHATDKLRQLSRAVNKWSHLPSSSSSEACANASEYVYRGRADSPIMRRNTKSKSRFIEEDETNWHAISSHEYPQHANPQPADQEILRPSTSSTPSTSTVCTEDSHLLLDPYMLAMATCGHWSPPIFFRAWSRQNPRSQSAAPRTELPSKNPREPRKLRKKVARFESEPGLSYWLPPRFVRPLSWVKGKRIERAGGNANLIAPEQSRIEEPGNAQSPPGSTPQHSTFQALGLSTPTTLSDNPSNTLQPATSADHPNPSLGSYLNTSTFLPPGPRGISPAPSTTSSLILPGRELTQEEYFRRTNRPRENLQPRQLTPPPGLEAERDPYNWQAWARGRTGQESKTDRLLRKDSIMRRPSTGNVNKRGDRNSWYDEFRKKMKEEQIQARKEQKEADKEKKKEKKKLERQERRRKEYEARESLRRQGMFSGGYLARYT